MPLFSNKPVEISYTWTFNPTRLVTSDRPSFAHLEAVANSELSRLQDFVSYKSAQNQQMTIDLNVLSRHKGRVILPPVRQKIEADKYTSSPMNNFIGHDWPSLTHDFGVKVSGNHIKPSEFRINFEVEKINYFPSIEPLYRHFEKLGFPTEELADLLIDMRQIEDELHDKKINPHPKDKIGRKVKVDFEGHILRKRNLLRYEYQYNFNKIADEQGVYLHVRFENQNTHLATHAAFNQDLVFVFPTSNEERDIWRHVFWNEEYPAAGFPVETTYARELTALKQQNRSFNDQDHKLAAEFSRMNMSQQGNPPAYISN